MNTYEIVNRYLAEAEIVLAASTTNNYRSVLYEFAKTCGKENADRAKIIEHIKALKAKGNSNNSIRCKLTCIKVFVRWAFDNGYYERDFAANIPQPQPEYHVAERMTKDEVVTMLHMQAPKRSHVNNIARNKAIMELAIVTASRVSAICALNAEDIDLERRTVTFKHTKRNKELVMPLTESLCKVLKEYMENDRPQELAASDPLFVGETPKKDGRFYPLTRQQVYNISKQYTEAACGKALSPHKLRHTSASIQLESGKLSLDEISKNLGHSSVSTTQRYAQRLNDNGRRTATTEIFEGL